MTDKKLGTFVEESSVRGYLAKPPGQPAPLVLVFMEIWGINDHIQFVCEKLAGLGFAAFALDFYDGALYAPTDLEGAVGKLKSLGDQNIMERTGRALSYLKGRKDILGTQLGVMGFCNGGRLAFLTSITYPRDVRASVCFYGGGIDNPSDRLGRTSVLGGVPQIEAPLLLCYGAKDGSITPDEHGRIAAALSRANKRYTLSVFPDVGHAFMDQAGPAEAEATAIAWQMAGHFLAGSLKTAKRE